jgi:small subunit ribosomal protein S8
MMTDPISDMLTRIRNGIMARHDSVTVPFSKLKQNLSRILEQEKYIKSVSESKVNDKPVLEIKLKYSDNDGTPAIKHLARISKPGKRVYGAKDELPNVLNGYGIAIISTPVGLLTNREARKRGVGGEIICEIH